jgi:hypothetical protein
MRATVAAVALVAVAAGCRGGDTQYSRGDVMRAFRSEGIQLLSLRSRLSTPSTRVVFLKKEEGEEMLAPDSGGVPNSGGPFFVLLYNSEKRAAFAFQTLTSYATHDTFELRRRNVVVTSDEGLTSEIRKRVRRALAGLDN